MRRKRGGDDNHRASGGIGRPFHHQGERDTLERPAGLGSSGRGLPRGPGRAPFLVRAPQFSVRAAGRRGHTWAGTGLRPTVTAVRPAALMRCRCVQLCPGPSIWPGGDTSPRVTSSATQMAPASDRLSSYVPPCLYLPREPGGRDGVAVSGAQQCPAWGATEGRAPTHPSTGNDVRHPAPTDTCFGVHPAYKEPF